MGLGGEGVMINVGWGLGIGGGWGGLLCCMIE